jgi:hypothetical protein
MKKQLKSPDKKELTGSTELRKQGYKPEPIVLIIFLEQPKSKIKNLFCGYLL